MVTTYSELVEKIKVLIPDAYIEFSLAGEIVVWTGLREVDDEGTLVSMESDAGE